MNNTKTTKALLEAYYEGFAKKEGWETVIADDFKYVGGDMANRVPITGKAGYIAVINRFSRIFQQMRVKKMIVDGDNACVIGNYDYQFPNGEKMNGDVSEIWTAKDGKLTSLTIFFDTLTFDRNTPKAR
ncbi:MAG: nuclear transport factor 2 family protein [Chitinophagaceae bacterium]